MEQNDEIICFYDPIKKEEEVRSSFEKELNKVFSYSCPSLAPKNKGKYPILLLFL